MTQRLNAYLLEVESRTTDDPVSLASRVRASSGMVRFLRSIYLPDGDRWFVLCEGASARQVRAAAERADVRVLSIAVARTTRSGEVMP